MEKLFILVKEDLGDVLLCEAYKSQTEDDLPLYTRAQPSETPVAEKTQIPITENNLRYISRYGGFCRDCADENGTCPTKGLPCDFTESKKAIRSVLAAVNYGIEHGFLPDAPSSKGFMKISNDWLKNKIQTDPDIETEAGVMHPEALALIDQQAAANFVEQCARDNKELRFNILADLRNKVEGLREDPSIWDHDRDDVLEKRVRNATLNEVLALIGKAGS